MYPQMRRLGYRKQFKKFVVSCEGSTTEREYLKRLENLCWNGVVLDPLTNTNETSPIQVLNRIRNYNKTLSPGDELWCVVDKDKWTAQQFEELLRWKQEPSKIFRGIALSNPKFELWLLAHFIDIPAKCGASECDRFLKQFQPGYDKHLNPRLYTSDAIRSAITRSHDSCPDTLPPFGHTGTNVGVLVEHILAAANQLNLEI